MRNRADGSVEAAVEGDVECVERFEAAIRRGPAGARVDSVAVEEQAASGRVTGFEVSG